MAIEIRSNYAVIDETGKFPYVTILGDTYHQELYNYLNNENVVISVEEFSALNTMISDLKSLNVWNGITEFFPLMGNTINSQLVKLKSSSNTLAEKFNAIDNSFTDGKGLNFTTQLFSGAKAINTGITNLDVFASNTGFGFITYFQNNPTLVVNDRRTLFGQSALSSAFNSGDLGFSFLNTSDMIANQTFSSSNIIVNTVDTMLYVSLINWNASKQISKRVYRANGNQLLKTTSTANITKPSYEDSILLGAQKVKDSSSAIYGWAGKIRLFISYDGTIPEETLPQVETIINQFIANSGKTL